MEWAQPWIGKSGVWTQAVMSLSLQTAPVIFWALLTTSFTLVTPFYLWLTISYCMVARDAEFYYLLS
jgi:hypothetical protein